MFDHVGLKVRDLAASTRFYRAVLEPLGLVFDAGNHAFSGLGPKGPPAMRCISRSRLAELYTSRLRRVLRAAVERVFTRRVAAGGCDNGKPSVRTSYAAAFMIDPDGNNVEAVCLKD